MICGTVLWEENLEAQRRLPVELCSGDDGKAKIQLYVRIGCTRNKTIVKDGVENGATIQFQDCKLHLSTVSPLSIAKTFICGILLCATSPLIAISQDAQGTYTERLVELEIKQRSISNTLTSVRVKKGEKIRLHWTTDETVVLHLHGYDIEISVSPGTATEMTFEASATGRFPITSHGFGAPDSHNHDDEHTLTYLEVYPDQCTQAWN